MGYCPLRWCAYPIIPRPACVVNGKIPDMLDTSFPAGALRPTSPVSLNELAEDAGFTCWAWPFLLSYRPNELGSFKSWYVMFVVFPRRPICQTPQRVQILSRNMNHPVQNPEPRVQ
jgi:hypothetical protein